MSQLATIPRVFGSVEPRIWTPPLRELTPDTSYGFDVIDFAEDLGRPLDPWQQWLVIHAGELLADGRPRFRQVLVMVARQNGKTELLVILTAFWLLIDQVAMVVGTSTKLDYAKESWEKARKLIQKSETYSELLPTRNVRRANGEVQFWTTDVLDNGDNPRYRIAPSNAEGGRSLTIDRLVMDELRQHYSYEAWDAAVPATNAVRDAQVWSITNAGSDRSVVLNDLQDAAHLYLKTGKGDPRAGIFEWSAADDADPLDVEALAQANPNLGYRIDPDALLGDAQTAVTKGGQKLTGFMTENMCIRVRSTNPAIDPLKWDECFERVGLDAVRERVFLGVDAAPDLQHITLVAAAVLDDGRVAVDPVQAWQGPEASAQFRAALRPLLLRVRPRAFGWLPDGPTAALTADLRRLMRTTGGGTKVVRTLFGVRVEEIKTDTNAVCMGFAEQVFTKAIRQPGDALLSLHVTSAQKVNRGEGWRFERPEGGNVDGAYAAAVAVHLARTSPAGPGRPRIITSTGA